MENDLTGTIQTTLCPITGKSMQEVKYYEDCEVLKTEWHPKSVNTSGEGICFLPNFLLLHTHNVYQDNFGQISWQEMFVPPRPRFP